jgi:hypothetical protein
MKSFAINQKDPHSSITQENKTRVRTPQGGFFPRIFQEVFTHKMGKKSFSRQKTPKTNAINIYSTKSGCF